ncbi:MAG: LolA family protein [Flavobacteriales bacterium]
MKKLLFLAFIALSAFTASAQTADEILASAKTATGGAEWDKVNSIKMTTVIEQQGMKIPMEIVVMRDGRTYTKISVQGMEIYQNVFDGTTLWSTNFISQKAEKADSESTENYKREMKDFPSSILSYNKNAYPVVKLEDATIDGVNCFKIQITKKTQLVEGKEVANVEYNYIDKESFALIMTESEIMGGEMKGKIEQLKFSDYQEVSGVFMPYAMDQGIKDLGSQTITFTAIEINPTIDEELFKYKGE